MKVGRLHRILTRGSSSVAGAAQRGTDHMGAVGFRSDPAFQLGSQAMASDYAECSVNCLNGHENEKLLSHSITTAMSFGSSIPGGYYATEPDRLWASHFSSPRPQIYAGNSK